MNNSNRRVLVTDFDGTMTKHDFYELVSKRLLPADTPNYWADYRAGRMTHFEALRGYFAAIRANEATVLQLVDSMEIDPKLHDAVATLERGGWKIVIASAGCLWYIDRLLAAAGVALEVHANLGSFENEKGLWMEMPINSPFVSATHGVDKAAIVRHYLTMDAEVAFAGDGFPDVDAARLVSAERRFARGDLAQVLTKNGESFQLLEQWSDIATALADASRNA